MLTIDHNTIQVDSTKPAIRKIIKAIKMDYLEINNDLHNQKFYRRAGQEDIINGKQFVPIVGFAKRISRDEYFESEKEVFEDEEYYSLLAAFIRVRTLEAYRMPKQLGPENIEDFI